MRQTIDRTSRLANAIPLVAILLASPLPAQELEEIVVTATRRPADIQDVPLSVSAYSGEFLDDSAIDTLRDLAFYAPNFTFSTSSQPTNARIAIRGISSVGNNAIEPAVGVFIDGVYHPRPGSQLGNLLDIAAVEVLRGPQGTLYGRNTAAGALNITSRAPTDAFAGHLELAAGDYGARAVEAVLGGPLASSLGGRIALRHAERDGYGENRQDGSDIGEREDFAARGRLELATGERLAVGVIADYAEIDSGGNVIELLNDSANPAFDATLGALFGETATTADSYDFVVNQDHRDRLRDEQWGIALDIEYRAGQHVLRSITASRRWQASTVESSLRIPADVLPRLTDYDSRSVSQEFQLASDHDGPVEYIAGLYLYDEDYDIGQDFDAGADACIPVVFALAGAGAAAACAAAPQAPAVTSDFSQGLTSYAAFAQATVGLGQHWDLTAGLRYTTEDKSGSFLQALPNPVIGNLFRAAESEPDLSADDDALTWLVALRYYANDDVMLYGSLATGFKGGGFNSEGAAVALGRDARTFDAETSQNLELGLRSELLGKRLRANLTWYYTELEDFQDRSFDGMSFITRNAGSRTQSGIEADLEFRPAESLYILAGVSYLDAEFDRFDAASPLPGDSEPQDLSGQRPHYAPDWQGSLVADWTVPLPGRALDWSLRAEALYVGEQNVGGNTNQNPQSREDDYTLINVLTGVGTDRWRLSLHSRNLNDSAYCQGRFDQPLGEFLGAVDVAANTAVQRCVLGEPRSYGVTLRYIF